MRKIYHGIILDLEFKDPDYPFSFKIFAKRKSTTNPWVLFGIEVNESELDKIIFEIQQNLKADKPYYAHLYNDKELIVIFKEKIFRATSDVSNQGQIIKHGIKLGIPKNQLDFQPRKFKDEIQYFNKKNL